MSYSSRFPEIMRSAERDIDQANKRSAERIAEAAARDIPRDTSNTAEGIEVIKDPKGDGYLTVVPFPGHILEFGSVKMAARPFLTPAAEAEKNEHHRAVKRAFE